MPFYIWWAIPLVATLGAVAWLSWRARERTIDAHDSVAERARFVKALEQPRTPPNRPVAKGDAAPDAADRLAADSGSDASAASSLSRDELRRRRT